MKYYIANSQNQPEGPYTVDELKALNIAPATLVYNDHLGNWTPAAEVPEIDTYVFGGAQNPLTAPNGGYQPCGPGQTLPHSQQAVSQGPAEVMPRTWLAESILVTIFCCIPLGIVGIVKASQVSSLYASGNYNESLKASQEAGKWTKWGFIIGVALEILGTIGYIAFVGLAEKL